MASVQPEFRPNWTLLFFFQLEPLIAIKPPVSCLCSVDDSNEVLTFFDDKCSSCDAGASVCWNGIMSCGVSEVGGRSEAWTLNASGRKTLSLRKGFKISPDVLTASGKWVTVFL